jgi:protein SCO1
MENKNQWISKVLLTTGTVILIGSLVGLFWLNNKLGEQKQTMSSSDLPVLVQLPSFSLVESSNNPMGLDNLKGFVWIADFIFTRCAGPCPLMSSRLSKLQTTFKDESSLRLVSITVDPEYDTPRVLSEYANRFQATKDRWYFLTGDKAKIHELAKGGFLVGGVEDVTLHSTRFILVDRRGRVRGYYDSQDDQDIQKLIHDTELLLREVAS